MSKSNPLVTFALIAFNQEKYIREAVEGAFSQTYQPLQIILSDDCSPDRTFEIMRQMVEDYSGPHQVIVNRNQINQRLANHVNKVISLAEGGWIALAAGDNISMPDRISTMMDLVLNRNDQSPVLAAFSGAIGITAEGEDLGTVPVLGASGFYHRSLFEVFGPFRSSLRTEDLALLFRANLIGTSIKDKTELIKYRTHDQNLWARKSEDNHSKIEHASRQLSYMSAVYQQMLADQRQIGGAVNDDTLESIYRAVWHARWQSRLLRSKISNIRFDFRFLKSKRLDKLSKFLLLWLTLPKWLLVPLLSLGSRPRVVRYLGQFTIGLDRTPITSFYRDVVRVQHVINAGKTDRG